VRWIQDDKLVLAAGEGLIQLYHVAQDESIKCLGNDYFILIPRVFLSRIFLSRVTHSLSLYADDGTKDHFHTDIVRELAPNPFSNCHVASGGFDHTLRILDLTIQQRCTRTYSLGDAVGSVRWSALKNVPTVSATIDDGKLFLFDIRAATQKSSLYFTSNKTVGLLFLAHNAPNTHTHTRLRP
jgi:WD40 repeat protein